MSQERMTEEYRTWASSSASRIVRPFESLPDRKAAERVRATTLLAVNATGPGLIRVALPTPEACSLSQGPDRGQGRSRTAHGRTPVAHRRCWARDRVLTEDELRILWREFEGLEPTMAAFYKLRLVTARCGAMLQDTQSTNEASSFACYTGHGCTRSHWFCFGTTVDHCAIRCYVSVS
jgi:hypothetical protein